MSKIVFTSILIIMTFSVRAQENSISFAEISNSKKTANYTEHSFRNRDSLNIVYYRFDVENPKARLLFIPGGGAYSQLGYIELAEILKDKYNVETTLIDLEGHGKSEGSRGDCPQTESIYQDITDLANILDDNTIPIYLGGHSSGGGLALNYSTWDNDSLYDGYVFVTPELGYKSQTARKGRVDFAKIKTGKFITNALSGGKLNGHSYAVELNYPKDILEKYPLIVSKLTVNMANALTPQNPKKQISNIKKPIAIFVGENDELFEPKKVLDYKNYQTNNNQESVAKEISNTNHLSILLNIGNEIGETIEIWNQ